MKRRLIVLGVVLWWVAACMTGSTDKDPEAENPDPSLREVYTEMLPPMPESRWHIHDPTQVVRLGGY